LGPQTAHALKAKQIDALALWDHAYAGLENIGFKFRHFTTPETSALLGFMLIANENFVNRNPEATAKLVQGIAKSVVFARTNPTAAVRLHWELFPSSKPNNVSEDEAIRQAVHLLNSRLDKYRIKGRKTERWGYFENDDWEQTQNFFYTTGLLKKKIDVQDYFTNRFIDLLMISTRTRSLVAPESSTLVVLYKISSRDLRFSKT
jgi:NitT/TauT family transport system substrate-binding protein